HPQPAGEPPEREPSPRSGIRAAALLKWVIVAAAAGAVLLMPPPNGVTPQSWHLLAIFIATIVGSILRPVPAGAIVLLGVCALAGGVIFPIAKSLAEAYDSHPNAGPRRLGAYLMTVVYQCDVVACAMFLTGQASNVLIARFARDVGGVELTYTRWLLGAIVPG